MQVIMSTSRASARLSTKVVLAAACSVGWLLCAGVGSAEAGRRSGGSWTGVTQLPQKSAPVVRHHGKTYSKGLAGGVQVTDSPSPRRGPRKWPESSTKRCPGSIWAGSPAACRNHRR